MPIEPPEGGGPARARAFVRTYASAAARNREVVGDYAGEFAALGSGYVGRMAAIETMAGVRVSASRERGGLELRARWADDALGTVFLWGDEIDIDATRHAAPRVVVAGPGTEVVARHQGAWRNLRVGIHGRALDALSAGSTTADAVASWSRPGLRRPDVDAVAEWRLQRSILRASRFAEEAQAPDARFEAALEVAAQEVVGDVMSLLQTALRGAVEDGRTALPRRRLATAAIELLEASPDEPVSISLLCRRLDTSERTMQRAFQEAVGTSLRAYERQRRLRAVHGVILSEGDRRSITDIAMSFGFWHLGRFAGAYRSLFGCSPAETRRQVWRDAVVAEMP